MTRPMIQQHMRVEVCRFCGCLASECKGTCVSKTAEIDVVVDGVTETRLVTYETVPVERVSHRKLKTQEFWAWPEWQALLKRMELPPAITNLTLTLNCRDAVRLEIKSIGTELPCPTPPSDTRHMDSDSSTAEHDPHPHSADTTTDGEN